MREEAGADLIARARHDHAAFGEVYDLYVRRIYAFCLVHSASREEAEDLTAQTFERALGAIGRYQDLGVPLSAWLLRIAANAAADRARRRGRIIVLGEEALPAGDAAHAGPGDLEPEQWAERWERASWLRRRLAVLPRDQYEAVRLRYLEDQAVREVALQMGRSEGAVKQLLHRAMAALRGQVGQEATIDV